MAKRWLTLLLMFPPALLFGQDGVYGLKLFYAWWMLLAGGIFSLVFYLLWKMKTAEGLPDDKIEGIRWFALALATWSASGLMNLLVLHPDATLAPGIGEIMFRSVFSSCNSVFILFTIPSIEIQTGGGGWARDIIAWTKSKRIVLLVAGLMFTVTIFLFLLFRYQLNVNPADTIWYGLYVPDVLFSACTIAALLFVFRSAFKDEKRRMPPMVYVVYLTLFCTLLAELSLVTPLWTGVSQEYAVFYNLVATIFKMLLIVLFAILLYSWEMKIAEELKMSELLEPEACQEKFGLDASEVLVLRRLARGETRDDIGSDPSLWRQPGRSRKNVDEMLEKKIAPKLKLPNKESVILLYALHHKIVAFAHPIGEKTAVLPGE